MWRFRDEPTAAIIPQEFFAFDGQNLSREDLKSLSSFPFFHTVSAYVLFAEEIYDEIKRV